jgi:rhodanese-related sulfurtransferase
MSEFLQRLPEFVSNHPLLSMAAVGVVVAAIANEASRLFRGYQEVTPAQLTMLINRENAMLFDVSPQADFEKGHIAGARHVSMANFDPENKELAKLKDKPVALVCRTGQTSGQAAARLKKAGFTRVVVLGGGIASWITADLPLAKGKA